MHRKHIVATVLSLCFSVGIVGSAIADLGDCGQPVTAGPTPTATDALAILVGAVGLGACDISICDVNCSLSITATDALTVLQFAVGQPVTLRCAPCDSTTTTTTTSTTTSTTTTTTTSTTTTTTTTSTTTTTLGGGFPALTSGDFPAVTPCVDRDTFTTDGRFTAALAGATQLILTVNFTQFDPNGFPEICGLSDVDNTLAQADIPWDPAAMNETGVCHETSQVSDFTQFYFYATPFGPDLCQSTTLFAGEGFPRAGIYRKDYCIDFGADHYNARVRKTITGPQADVDFTTAGVLPADVRVCDGTTLIATDTQARALIAANPNGFTVTLRDSDCATGADLITVELEIICIKSMLTACPQDVACSP